MQDRLITFLSKHKLKLVKKISKGHSSEVFLVKNSRGKKLALKIEKDKSRRFGMAVKEANYLKLANTFGVGPKLFAFDFDCKCILMEFVDGAPFDKWFFEKEPTKKALKKFIENLLEQAKELDKVGISHGQLAGKGRNILVRNNLPVIIDFEKASIVRRARNENQIKSFLFDNPKSSIAKKIKKFWSLLDKFSVDFQN